MPPAIIIPGRQRHSHPLRDILAEKPDRRRFKNQIDLVDALSAAVVKLAATNRMRVPEVLDALLTATASFIQSQAPKEEWGDVGAICAEELRARLVVTGDTGEDHHPRRML